MSFVLWYFIPWMAAGVVILAVLVVQKAREIEEIIERDLEEK